ncbi:MAG: hypothetical protein ACRD6N_07200 [Pyrinomonadaceae bacterium]
MRRSSVVLSIAAPLTLVLLWGLAMERENDGSLVPSVQAKPAAVAPQIEGTWLLTVTTPPEAGRPPFKVLVSFARGGVFTASAESDQATPPQNGTWEMVGQNEYASTALSFGPNPNLLTIKIKSLYRLVSENELEGVGEAAICDASGNNCQRFPGCSTIHGTRLTVEPPACPAT